MGAKRRLRKGFTLIELLVVIAIIAILAAILFPVFARAKEKAQSIACLSHGKQLALALMMYCQDYDETIVRERDMVNEHFVVGTWAGETFYCQWWWCKDLLDPYVKNDGIWVCPKPEGPAKRYAYGYQMTWMFRTYTAAPYWGDEGIGGKSLATFDAPASKIAAWCVALRPIWAFAPHHGGSNYVYLDGHAKWSKLGNYWAPPGYPAPGMTPPYN